MDFFVCIMTACILAVVGTTTAKPTAEQSLEELTGDDIRYRPMQRNAMKYAGRWPNGEVPYVIEPDLSFNHVNVINQAIQAYNQQTCIRLIPKTSQHRDYVRFMDGGPGRCYSYIGRVGGAQDLSLGYRCDNFAVVLHEIEHALGFDHEHNRPDRDNYVSIRLNRVQPAQRPNFDKREPSEVELRGLRYDYLSVMHYGRRAFSASNEDTIVTLDPTYQDQIGHRPNFSQCDLEKINRHYQCTSYILPHNPCSTTNEFDTTTPNAIPTWRPSGCEDDPTFPSCKYVNQKPRLCQSVQGFMSRCKRSCNNCQKRKRKQKCKDAATGY